MAIIDGKQAPPLAHPPPQRSSENSSDTPPPYTGPPTSSSGGGRAANMPAPQSISYPSTSSHDESSPLLGSNDIEGGQRKQRESNSRTRLIRRRLFHFTTITCLALLLFFFLSGQMSSSSPSRSEGNDGSEHVTKPDPARDGYTGKPVKQPSWTPIGHEPSMMEPFVQTTVFHLDANSAGLFLHSLGARHHGRVIVKAVDTTDGDDVKVTVEARSTAEWILKDALTVAKMQDGDRIGVGIYTDRDSFNDHRHRLNVTVIAELPTSASSSSSKDRRSYGDFEVQATVSGTSLEGLGEKITFPTFTVGDDVGSIRVQGGLHASELVRLRASAGSIHSTGPIDTDVLEVHSDVGSLHFSDTIRASKSASIRTSAGSIHLASLFSPKIAVRTDQGSIHADHVEGADIVVRSSAGSVALEGVSPTSSADEDDSRASVAVRSDAGRVRVEYKSSKLGSSLAKLITSDIRTSAGSVVVDHWPGFTGQFDARTSMGSLKLTLDDGEKPRRRLEMHGQETIMPKHTYGCVYLDGQRDQTCEEGSRVSSSKISSDVGSVQIRL